MTNFRLRKWRLGSLRGRVSIQQPVETQDGYGEPVVTWENWLINEPAEFRPVSGVESMRGQQVEANMRAKFVVRYREGYETNMRVVYEGREYGITFVNPVEGGRRYLELVVAASGDL